MKPVKSLTLGGIMAGLFALCAVILRFEWIPGIELIILFFVPFLAAYYSLKNKFTNCLVFALSTIIICLFIDWASTLLYILPTVVVGLLYGFMIKAKQNGYTIVYLLTVVELGLTFFASLVIKWVSGVSLLDTFNEIYHLSSSSSYLALGLLVAFCFVQSFAIHMVMKLELKKVHIEMPKDNKPPFWLLLICLIAIVSVFFEYDEDIYSFFSAAAAIIFGVPICLYGYQSCEKVFILPAIQTGLFLCGSLPMLLKFEGYEAVKAYIILFIPPLVYAFYELITENTQKEKK